MAMVQYWSSGLRPFPSATLSSPITPLPAMSILNGLSTKEMRIRKNVSTLISTAVTYGIMSRNLRRF